MSVGLQIYIQCAIVFIVLCGLVGFFSLKNSGGYIRDIHGNKHPYVPTDKDCFVAAAFFAGAAFLLSLIVGVAIFTFLK